MALIRGKFIDPTQVIKQSQDPSSGDDVSRKSYVDSKATLEAASAAAAAQSAAQSYADAGLALKQNSLGTGTTSQYLRGDLTWQEVPTSVGIAQTKVVTKGGSDVTGDGTLTKPYATIGAALASITDASPTKRYLIKVQAGAYTEGAIALKANVFICGDQKEAVRISATSFALASDFSGSADNRSGMSKILIAAGNANFDWGAVTSAAGKLYFSEVSTNGSVTLTGHNNAIAQAQFDSCIFFGAMTISGINVGVYNNCINYANITLNQHPNGGMATILAANGGYIGGTVTLNTTVTDFSRRCSLFARSFYMGALTVNGASSYADVTDSSLPPAGPTVTNSGNVVYLNPVMANSSLSNLSYPTAVNQSIMPAANSATNLGDWGKQWFFNFSYVHASAGTDMYLLSVMQNYDSAGDSAGRNIFINADGYGLKPNVSGGNIELETAAVSGTGIKGKVTIKARELDMTSVKITNLADGTISTDAVNKSQLDAQIAATLKVPHKESKILSNTDISNGYIDITRLAVAESTSAHFGGAELMETDDYTVSTVGGITRITFSPAILALMSSGDKVYTKYWSLT